MSKDATPLLLLDNSTMYVVGDGTYKVEVISFEEARSIIDIYEDDNVLCCYSDRVIDQVIHDFIGVTVRDFQYKRIRKMRPQQHAIVFKQYITESETKPIVEPEPGMEAKKIQNIYVYCEYISRLS